MPNSVRNSNNVCHHCPQTFQEIVDLINHIKEIAESVFIQITCSAVEVVRQVAKALGTNMHEMEDHQSLNPFTVIYIDQEGQIKSNSISERSKIILYARRPIHHN
jgi:Flp pilus assembly secretin CpaC